MSTPDVGEFSSVSDTERGVARDLRQVLLSGVMVTVPFFVTLIVLTWMLNLVSNALSPLVDVMLALGPVDGMTRLLVEGIAFLIVFGVIFVVGLAAQHGPSTNLGDRIDVIMEDVPGVGSIYTSVDRMSEVLLESDTESFQEVKLVEFPNEGRFVLAFLTADSPSSIESAAGHSDMVTVFVPLAPNPVMGGHLLYVSRDEVHDVDLSVEEGMQAVMTTGVAVDKSLQEK